MTIADLIFYAAIGVLVLAAVQDLAVFRISNLLSVALVLLFIAWLAVRGLRADVWTNAAAFAVLLGFGTFCFTRGWLGGGDVKLMTAAGLWFGWPASALFLMWTGLAGGLLTIGLFVLRRTVSQAPTRHPMLVRNGAIPYGVAIAIGAVAALLIHGPNPPRALQLFGFG